jgi:hypothetical protein
MRPHVRRLWQFVPCHAGRGLDRLAVQSLKHGGRAVVKHTTTYVAFDNSKETLAVAIADGGTRGEMRFWGTIANRAEAVRKLVARLAAKHPGITRGPEQNEKLANSVPERGDQWRRRSGHHSRTRSKR